jgi:hypothetical protein
MPGKAMAGGEKSQWERRGRSHCSVEDRKHVAVAAGSGAFTRIVHGALRAVSLGSTREECFWAGYSFSMGAMSRLSAT